MDLETVILSEASHTEKKNYHMTHLMCGIEKEMIQIDLSSVAQSCLTLCNPMNCSTPGLPVHQKLLEFTQTHAHRVGDAIQPLLSPSPPAPDPSKHQGLFQ